MCWRVEHIGNGVHGRQPSADDTEQCDCECKPWYLSQLQNQTIDWADQSQQTKYAHKELIDDSFPC
jgi:hypothetical protein